MAISNAADYPESIFIGIKDPGLAFFCLIASTGFINLFQKAHGNCHQRGTLMSRIYLKARHIKNRLHN